MNVEPVEMEVPPVEAAYHCGVPLVQIAPNSTVPVPQILPFLIAEGEAGIGLTVAFTSILTDSQPADDLQLT